MSEELKPCPFCGGEAVVDKVAQLQILQPSIAGLSGTTLENTGEYKYFVFCKKCGVSKKKLGHLGKATKSYKTHDKAISAWNTRHEPLTEPRALTLEEFLKHIEDNSNHPLWMALLEPYQGQWYTVKSILEEFNYTINLSGKTADDLNNHLRDVYGEVFLCYAHKPKED